MATRLGKVGEYAKARELLGGVSLLAIISSQPLGAQTLNVVSPPNGSANPLTESNKTYSAASNAIPAIKVNSGAYYQGTNITINAEVAPPATGGFGLWVTGGNATLTDSTIITGVPGAPSTQASQYGVYAQGAGSIVTLNGGTVSTYDSGVNNYGLYALNGGQITSSANIATSGSTSSYAVYTNNGTINITGNSVTIDSSGGLPGTGAGAPAAVLANGATGQITTASGSTVAIMSLGNGVQASGGGQITLNSGTTITTLGTGTTSHGIVANGAGSLVTSFADSVTVTGGGSWGVYTYGGTVTGGTVVTPGGIIYLNAGTITNNGTGNGGGLSAQAGGQIIADGSAAGNTPITVTSGGIGAYVTSGGTISLTDATVTAGGNGLSAGYNGTTQAGGTINFTGGSVTSSVATTNAGALYTNGANTTINVYGAAISATAGNASGAYALAGGHISLDSASTISSVGSGTNATLYASGAGSQIVSAADVNTGANVAATAAYAATGGAIFLNGGTVVATTTGLYANTGGTISADASIPGNTAITVNSSGVGVNANGGNVTLVGSTINATGVGLETFVNAGTAGGITATNVTVTTTAASGFGAYANGNSQITVNGGSITTSGDNAHGLEVNGGTITIGANGNNTTVIANGAGADAIFGTAAGGTVTITNGNLSSSQADAVGVLAGTATTVNVSATTLSGAGNLVSGAGVANITASNASQLTGAAASANSSVTLQSGSIWHLSAPVGAATASTLGSLTMDSGTVQYNTAAPLTLTSGVALNAGGGTFDTNGFNATIGSPISGVGSLTKIGAGTLALTNANSFGGGTSLDAGTILVGNASALGVGTLAMAATTTLDFDNSYTLGNAITLSGVPFINVNGGLTVTLTGVISDGMSPGTLEKTGAGKLILIADNTYSGDTTINAGTLQLGNGGSTGSIVGNVANDGTLAFNRSNTLSFAGVISGSGGVDQIGSGTTVLSGANSYSGPTNVLAGTLAAGAVGTFSPNSAVSVASAGSLDLDGFSQTIAGLTNGGLVNMGTDTTPGTVLTVTGNYVGNGGTIAFNTVLGNDSSLTDLMVVGGSISGSTNVLVTNVGGSGAVTTGNGIELVQVTGNSGSTAGAFTLAAPAVAGPYDYTLFHGSVDASGPQNWYLRSTLDCSLAPNAEVCASPTPRDPPTPPMPPAPPAPPHYRIETSLNAALPSMTLLYGRNLLDTLHERVGEEDIRGGLHQDGPTTGWVRVIGTGGKQQGDPLGVFGAGPQFSYGFVGLQGGQDLLRREYDAGSRDHAGVTFAVGSAHGDVTHFDGTRGDDELQAYTLGGYWTHFGALGWYVDTMLQGTLYNARTTANRGLLPFKTKGNGVAGSVEAGYPFKFANGYFIEPQAQLIYQNINFNDALDNAALVKFSNVDSLTARIGARFGRTWSLDGNVQHGRVITAWIRPNLWQEFRGNPITQFSSEDGFVPFRADLGGTWGEVNVGVSGQVNLNTTLFANASYQSRFDGGFAYNGKAGARISW